MTASEPSLFIEQFSGGGLFESVPISNRSRGAFVFLRVTSGLNRLSCSV